MVMKKSMTKTSSPSVARMTVEIGSPCAFFMCDLFSCCFCAGGI